MWTNRKRWKKMKISHRAGGRGFNPNHNDRKFNMDKANHINQDLTKDNLYIMRDYDTRTVQVYRGDDANKTMSLREHEINYYKNHYQDRLNSINERYIANRHAERCKTIEDMYKDKKTGPEEVILQIGKQDETRSIDRKTYESILSKYMQWQSKTYPQCKILDAAMHFDEKSPHVHMRQVWEFTNERGELQVGQTKALEQMGVQRPNMDQPADRHNNAKITFSNACREAWRDICIMHGLDIDEIEHTGKNSRDFNEVRADALKREIEGLEREIGALQETVQELSADEKSKLQAYEHVFGQPEDWGICDEFWEFKRIANKTTKPQRQAERERSQEQEFELS